MLDTKATYAIHYLCMGNGKSGNFTKRKLTTEQREEAMEMARKHGQSMAARAFGVSRGYIWQLLHPEYRQKKC